MAEEKSLVVVIKFPNKFFPFFSNLTLPLFILWIVLYTYLKFEETVYELVKMMLQYICIYMYIHKKT